MNITLVVDSLNWGGHHAAKAIARVCGDRHQFQITDIKGLRAKHIVHQDIVMAWLDSAENAIYKWSKKHRFTFCSRTAGWKGIYRATRQPLDLVNAVKGVVCCNPELAIASKKVYHNAQVMPIMNGVDLDVFKPKPISELGFGWGWVGRVHDEQKDVRMLKAVEHLLRAKVKVVMKTQTWIKGEVQKTDWPEEMVNYYRSRYGVFRTSRNEGSSNCLLEAMSCGLPVVATPTGIAFRLLDPRWLCTSARHMHNAIMELQRDRDLAIQVGGRNRGKLIADGWDWKDAARLKYLDFFERVVRW